MTEPVLQVQMLGGFSLSYGGREMDTIPSRQASSLLAFLVLRRARPQTRDLLAGRFWSDLAEDKARRRLSNALWMIGHASRQIGIDGLVRRTSSTIGINPALKVEVDAERFELQLDELERSTRNDRRTAGIDELMAIVDSYQGDLLAGYYDEWIEESRRSVRDRYLAAVSALVRQTSAASDFDTALRYGLELVAAEPMREEWHRDVMRLYALNGQPSAAERQFSLCREAMAELGVEPSAETVSYLEKIRQESIPQPAVVGRAEGHALPFIGRGPERSALLGRVNELVAGKGGLVLVEGEPGIGKSRLLEEVREGAEWRGVPVFTGQHVVTSALTPYDGLKEALAPAMTGVRAERLATVVNPVWLRQAATVLEGLRGVSGAEGQAAPLRPEEEPWRTTEALVQVILALGRPRPVVLVLEDVHRTDDDTMQVLMQLGDRLIDSGVLVVLSYLRTEAERAPLVWQVLRELEAKAGSSRIVLPPLDLDEVRQLVSAELGPGRMSAETMAQLAESTGGNPYVITELLRSPTEVFDINAYSIRQALGDMAGAPIPVLSDVLHRRMDAVPEAVRTVLEAVSAMTGPVTSKVVTSAVDLDRGTAVDALTEAIDRGFLVETASGCEFVQLQTRKALYDGIDPERRRLIHSRIADALVGERGVGVAQMAHHAWLAEQWHRAYQYHSLAAESALKVNAYHTTAEHYAKADQAAQSATMSDVDRFDELLANERVLDILGRRADQQALLDRLHELPDPAPRAALTITQRQAWLLAHTDRRTEAARLAADAVEPASTAGLGVGELLTIVGCARFWSGDLHGAIDPLEQAVAELEAESESILTAQVMLGRTFADLHEFEPAQLHLERSLEAAKIENDPRSQVEALGHLATLFHSRQLEVKAENALTEALSLARSIGYRRGEGSNLINLAILQLILGRSGRAVGLFGEAEEVFTALSDGRGLAFVRANSADLAHWVLGDDVLARSLAQQAAVYFRQVGDKRREATCLTTLASIDRRAGRRRLARRRLREAVTLAQQTDDPTTEAQAWMGLALTALELNHFDEARGHTEAALDLSRRVVLEDMVPVLTIVQAKASLGLGNLTAAVASTVQAIDLNRPGAYLSHLAAWWGSEILTAVGDDQAAADQVVLAHQLLARQLDGLPETAARRAWYAVAEHRGILDAQERYFANRVDTRLPRTTAPTGRPLAESDFVDVSWMVSHPDDWAVAEPAFRRRRRVLRLTAEAIEQGASARVADLASALEVSDRTIKRDLAQLRREGHRPHTRRSS